MSPEPLTGKIGKSVGEKLRAARVAQHYTQSQLAAPDFSVSYISAIERGQIHPSLRALEILAARLGLSSTQLLPTRSQQDAHMSTTLDIAERDDDEVELALLEAQLLIHQGDAEQAASLISKISTKRLKRQQLLLHRYLLGWAYFATERFQEAEYTLAEALQIAKELNTSYLTLRILNISALAHAAMRNYTQALISHEHCINLLATTPPHDPFFAAQIYTYMGQHYTQLEYVDRAIEMFHKALAMTEEFATLEDAQAIYRDICAYYANAKEDDLAVLHAYKSLYLSIQETNKHLRGELHHYLGHAIMKGDQEQARLYLDEALQQPGVLRDPLSLASVSTRNAEWHATHEQFTTAAQYARQAQELSQPFGDTIIAAEALVILGRIEYAISNYEQGDQHFTAGLEMFERLESHQELANESVFYAQLLEERGKEREAFTHLRRAFQSRQRLGR
jgi:transcriptional regulator with XRE-family HTH domain